MKRFASFSMVLSLLIASAVTPATASELVSERSLRQRYIVSLTPGTSAAHERALHESAGATVLRRIALLDLVLVEAPAGSAQVYRADPWVRSVGRERVLRLHDTLNDPLLREQWAMELLDLEGAWNYETGTRNPVLVAVVDSGVDPSHPDLQTRLVKGFDFANLDELPDDDNGHGTHVAGIVAATQDNRVGVAGMSWGAKIMPLKACNAGGACLDFAVLEAIVYGIVNGARVVNLSLGGAGESCPVYYEPVAKLAEQTRTALVASSGNGAQDGNPISFPASCPGFISVGATDFNDRWARFSTYNDLVDVSAPGAAVLSTLPPEFSDPARRGYGYASGTSMAAPHVSGLAALLLSKYPDWSAAEVQQRMEETAVDLGAKGHDPKFGHGRIDVRRALKR